MKIVDLGTIVGPIAVFGGIYSNIHAFSAFEDVMGAHKIPKQNWISTGDHVAYCGDPKRVVDQLMKLDVRGIKGNCEEQLADDKDDCGCGFAPDSVCSLLSIKWFEHAKRSLTQENKDWLGRLPDRLVFENNGKRFVVIHGGATDISRFIWPVSGHETFRNEFEDLESQVGPIDIVLAGHSGIPFIKEIDGKTWVNSGGLGMVAHNGRRHTHYAIIDKGKIKIHELSYDSVAAYERMISVGLDQGYHNALLNGFWPSEDTLPEKMRVKPRDDA